MRILSLFSSCLPTLSLLVLTISCSEPHEDTDLVDIISSYSWEKSSLSPEGMFSYAQFQIGDDGLLYAWGSSHITGQRTIYRYTGQDWIGIGEPTTEALSNLESLVILNGHVYFHVFDKLYKIEEGLTEEVLSGSIIWNVQAYQNKLIIIGEGIRVSDDTFTIVTYDGTTFEPISKSLALSRIIAANEKLYIQGYPGFAYDGNSLDSLNYYGYFYNVDDAESIFFGDALSRAFTMGKKLADGTYLTVGNTIQDFGLPQKVVLFDGTVVIAGIDEKNESSMAYALENERWTKIPTDHYIMDLIVFDNKLLCFSLDGNVWELRK